MFKKIMIPVDLAHQDEMGRALDVAADLARSHDGALLLVSVTSGLPGSSGHNPGEFRAALSKMAGEVSAKSGLSVDSHTIISPDPTVTMAKDLVAAAAETDSDLIVMATHLPGIMDHIFGSHGGYVASHARMSVLLIR